MSDAATVREELLHRLRHRPADPEIPALVERLERERPADLSRDGDRLRGVWELRWSSASQPWLKQAPWLENLQVLDPAAGRGMNLLRLSGPLGVLAAITVQADLAIRGPQRVEVTFRRGGWSGPRLLGQRLELLAAVKQPFPAWLDITVLDETLRICRGNAGTVFALLRRPDLAVEELLGQATEPVGPGPAGSSVTQRGTGTPAADSRR
ncbi:MAG: PAP/fibrillin family protein [Cyanobacteriota bacterium]|nr:PAP/fibrillin family protein [Cyanobacteriota bacterium]